jgi:DNA polymerase-3 subunit gamma/tau
VTATVPHQALYRRWRAQTFAQIVGQEAVVETLRNAVRAERVGHAILFVGPRGTGKTSLARILAKAVNCTDLRDGDACDACPSCTSIREGTTLDLIEIDAASNRGIDDVRGLRERLPYPPGQLKRKVYILDEAHQITPPAWNALLKSIEEPPDFVIFMFASTEPSGFPAAILSRLQRFDVRRLTVPEIEGKLGRILAADGRLADPDAIRLIARLAAGGMRDAESMLDQLLSAAPDRIDERHVRDLLGLADADVVEEFVDLLVRGDVAAGVALLDQLDERGRDIRALLDQVVEALRLELVAGLHSPALARHDPASLAAAGRRLAAIDPDRVGIGGLRFQLELALFGSTATQPVAAAAATSRAAAGAPLPAASAAAAVPVPARAVSSRPKPVTEATPPASPAPAAEVSSALDELLRAWPAIVTQLSAHPPTKPLVVACRPVAVDGAVVTLGFPEEQAFLKDAAERRRPAIEAGIAAVLGHLVTVRCVVANVELASVGPADAAFLLAEAHRIFGDDIVEVGEVN